ncbi:hypothetical protein ACFT38_36920 [Streptomyces sp. NPDC056975]|uniref:hypothetical protein n=1 Tax=Streptomyces sp. NPDC056975 TaxID=3345985 RepID=UPI003645AD0D
MLTTRHFDHVHAFLHARLDPLLKSARALHSDPLVTALAAMVHAVDTAHDCGTHVLATGGWAPVDRGRIVAEYWERLTDLAHGWQEHPSYEGDFELNADELGGVAPLQVQP